MMKPAIPKPTAEYIAAKRAECKKVQSQDGAINQEIVREQGPFWMSQANLAYCVPNSCSDINVSAGIPYLDPCVKPNSGASGPQEYNTVKFDDSIRWLNERNFSAGFVGGPPPIKYLAMGSFFKVGANADVGYNPSDGQIMGRYFLVGVGEKGYSIPNPESNVNKDGTRFAPPNSFILSFSGTETNSKSLNELTQDADWQTGPFWPSGTPGQGAAFEGYEKMIEAHWKIFNGVPPVKDCHGCIINNPMMGVREALENAGFIPVNTGTPNDDDVKQITIVGHSLGGAQAQLAAVQIATTYKAKVRVITFESILAFTPEGAQKVVDDFIVGPNNGEPTIAFPDEGGKITAQRWVEDDSPLTAAPLLLPAGWCCPIPILNIFNPVSWCLPFGPPACSGTWKDKYRLVGCWPCNGNLGRGYLSKALVISGYNSGLPSGIDPVIWGPPSSCPCVVLGSRCCRKEPPYPDDTFEFRIEKREYVTTGARRLRWISSCVTTRIPNHFQRFVLWMLYKGAYQNEDAPNSTLAPEQKVSQYVPKVYEPSPPAY